MANPSMANRAQQSPTPGIRMLRKPAQQAKPEDAIILGNSTNAPTIDVEMVSGDARKTTQAGPAPAVGSADTASSSTQPAAASFSKTSKLNMPPSRAAQARRRQQLDKFNRQG